MDARLIDRIETNVERAASALFGGALGFAAFEWLAPAVSQPVLGIYVGGVAAIGCLLCNRAVKVTSDRRQRFPVPIFDVRRIDPEQLGELVLSEADRFKDELILTNADRFVGELVLTNADRLDTELVLTDGDRLDTRTPEEPLVLDDILAELGPDARVVRLFDRRAMPTPGQLKSRIDDHLGQGARPVVSSDAAQALSEALAELRRSLR